MSESISAARYWVLRGSFGPGLSVEWASESVLHQSGPIDGRLVGDPSSFAIGLPSAIGAPPERITTTVELDNADGALDRWIVGAERTESEYTEPSFLTFEGRLYRGTIAADGTCAEEVFTPPLAASGSVDVDRSKGTVSLSLAHVDRAMLGPIRKVYTTQEFAAGGLVGIDCAYPEVLAEVDEDAIWALFGQTDNDESPIPWIYGPVHVPLTRVTPDGQYPAIYVAGMVRGQATLPEFYADAQASIVGKVYGEYRAMQRVLTEPIPALVEVDLPAPGGGVDRVVVAIAVQARAPRDKAEQYWWSSKALNGVTFGSGGKATPARVLREIIADHAEAGSACLHAASWDAVEAEQDRVMPYGCAGAIEAETTIAELIEYIAPIGDMGLWVGPDGLLHVTTGGWGKADADEAKGALPELIEPDVYPGDDSGAAAWSEAIPADPDDRGAVLTKVSVQWTEEQRELFPVAISGGTAPRRVSLAVDSEWTPPGDWINPREAGPVVRAMASRGAYPTRRVRFPSHPSLALLGPGVKLRVSHPWGVTAEPPYLRRLVRLERGDVQPGDHAAALTLEDLGPSEQIRLGLLDSIGEWLAVDPSKPKPSTLTLEVGGKALSTEAIFTSSMVGATIWAHGASLSENRRSYRIKKYLDGKTVEVDAPPSAMETIPSAVVSQLLDAPWLIMWTHESKGPAFRPDYIRGARLPDGLLGDVDRGFQFSGR